jgi:hypothetical protein
MHAGQQESCIQALHISHSNTRILTISAWLTGAGANTFDGQPDGSNFNNVNECSDITDNGNLVLSGELLCYSCCAQRAACSRCLFGCYGHSAGQRHCFDAGVFMCSRY